MTEKRRKLIRRLDDSSRINHLLNKKQEFLRDKFEELNILEFDIEMKAHEEPKGYLKNCTRYEISEQV